MGIKGTKLELIRLITETDDKALLDQAMQVFARANELKSAPSFTQEETELLLLINQGVSEEVQKRYNDLVQKSIDGSMSTKEQKEFEHLLPSVEAETNNRLRHLIRLAEIWQMPVDAVMERLGLTPPPILHA